tara:strand:- start:4478 stop:5443 length:966 start_codon:yes stop_codon:yes gene_type:complete
MTKIAVLGGGAWGTAIANLLAENKNDILLWAREKEVEESINNKNINSLFLPENKLSKHLKATSELQDIKNKDYYFLVIPSKFTENILQEINNLKLINKDAVFVICSKGIDNVNLRLISDIIKDIYPENKIGVMSGPNFAKEVAANKKVLTTICAEDKNIRNKINGFVSNNNFKTILANDIISAQLCGALKNVAAIGMGIAVGLNYSESSKAAILTKLILEMQEIIEIYGGKKEVILMPCGIGDLILTSMSKMSRNMSLGFEIAQGEDINDILSSKKSIAEGYSTAKAVYEISKKNNLELEIMTEIYEILYKNRKVQKGVFF